MKAYSWRHAPALVWLALALPHTPHAVAAPATVCVVGGACNSTGDLKAAIASAAPGAVITISAGEVTQQNIVINKNLTILGAGAKNTFVQAAGSPLIATDRVVVVNAGVTAIIEDVTVQFGYPLVSDYSLDSGGGLQNKGALTLRRVVVRDNSIRQNATSSIGVSGGGVGNLGTLEIHHSAIVNNSAGKGSDFTGSVCGGFCIGDKGGDGGGIFNKGPLTITNSTISGNRGGAPGDCRLAECSNGSFGNAGLMNNDANVTLKNVTITGNTGSSFGTGVATFRGVVTMANSVVVGNVGTRSPMFDCSAQFTANSVSIGYNVIGAVQDCAVEPGKGDIAETDVTKVLNTTLADNGGPTPTHALVANSPAINNGNPAAPSTLDPWACPVADQRGRGRNGRCDSGAFESGGLQRNPTVTLNQSAVQADPTPFSPIRFTVTFSEPVTRLNATGFSLVTGGAVFGVSVASVTEVSPNNGTTYELRVAAVAGRGTVSANVNAGAAIDAFGNPSLTSTSADNTVTFGDFTPPVIEPVVTGILSNGWYRSNVSIGWNVSDPESSIVSLTQCNTQGLQTDTAGTTYTCFAGSSGGTSQRSVVIKRDTTPPTLRPVVTPNPVMAGSPAVATPNATDSLSGIASQSCTPPDTTTGGRKTVNCTATDQAGNQSTASASYQVTYPLPQALACAANAVNALPPESLAPTAAKSKITLLNLINAASAYQTNRAWSLTLANVQTALGATDGCALRGSPDLAGSAPDLITSCAAQQPVYDCLKDAEAGLNPPPTGK